LRKSLYPTFFLGKKRSDVWADDFGKISQGKYMVYCGVDICSKQFSCFVQLNVVGGLTEVGRC
jgi:hypothetical protein